MHYFAVGEIVKMAANSKNVMVPVPTVDARILLGWMDKEEAIVYLLESCWFDPQLTEEQASQLWETHKQRVEELPERVVKAPERLTIPTQRRPMVGAFLSRLRGPEVLDVVKIDPMGLVVYQTYVVTDRADYHAKNKIGSEQWDNSCLLADRPAAPMQLRVEDGIVKVQLPHAEHMFALDNGAFRIQQGGGFISVCEVEGRMLLKAGYHRTFAFCRERRNEPDAKERSLLVALTKTVPPQLLTECPTQGLRTTILGPRPPFFSDFFDERLSISVKLRKKRFEMHIKVNVVPVDAES